LPPGITAIETLNRRAFQHAVIAVLVARDDPDSFLALAMLDLDHFKAINDTNGQRRR